jgi:hypothetical protein
MHQHSNSLYKLNNIYYMILLKTKIITGIVGLVAFGGITTFASSSPQVQEQISQVRTVVIEKIQEIRGEPVTHEQPPVQDKPKTTESTTPKATEDSATHDINDDKTKPAVTSEVKTSDSQATHDANEVKDANGNHIETNDDKGGSETEVRGRDDNRGGTQTEATQRHDDPVNHDVNDDKGGSNKAIQPSNPAPTPTTNTESGHPETESGSNRQKGKGK